MNKSLSNKSLSNRPLNVAILIFDDVEVLDFAGPFEVFTVANRDVEPPLFEVYTVAATESVVARGGLAVSRQFSLEGCPAPDVLLIPGGAGVDKLLESRVMVDWITAQAATSSLVTSVCTGSLLLGHCGLLDGHTATTHHRCFDQLREAAPQTRVLINQRFVDTGRVITSAGISAGIDMSLHIVGRLVGREKAREVARRMEYSWHDEGHEAEQNRNELGQPIGTPMAEFVACLRPARSPMIGRSCRVEPLDPAAHAEDLWQAFADDAEGRNWTYLPYGPLDSFDELASWLDTVAVHDDPQFQAIIDLTTNRAVGLASYLRMNPTGGVIEVGHIHYSPRLQRTPAATEAMFLMMSRVFDELGYRRYEWKCDALNERSRRAALRLGFSLEGVFRQTTIYKGRSRDTAWFSIIDKEWPVLKRAYQEWFSPANYDERGRQRQRLSALICQARQHSA